MRRIAANVFAVPAHAGDCGVQIEPELNHRVFGSARVLRLDHDRAAVGDANVTAEFGLAEIETGFVGVARRRAIAHHAVVDRQFRRRREADALADLGAHRVICVGRHRDGRQNGDHGDRDHDFKKRETALG